MTFREFVRGILRWTLRTDDVTETLRKHRLAIEKRVYRRSYALDELRGLLSRLGFERGRVVWVQSSWNDFYNLSAKPSEVIAIMRDMIGPAGTLVMPAFPLLRPDDKVLNIDVVPSRAGLLTEIFRRMRGTERSIHITASVCALGPEASFLTRDHHHDRFPWGPLSPYCRLRDVDARLVAIGLGPFLMNMTPLHAVECLLYDEVSYFHQIFQGTQRYRWCRRSGEHGEHETLLRSGRIRMRGYGRHFAKDSYVNCKLSNLQAFAIDAKTALDQAVFLGRRGVTIYVDPKPRPELFLPMQTAGSRGNCIAFEMKNVYGGVSDDSRGATDD